MQLQHITTIQLDDVDATILAQALLFITTSYDADPGDLAKLAVLVAAARSRLELEPERFSRLMDSLDAVAGLPAVSH